MSKPTQTPEKLTIQCIMNILSADDKTTLENKIWDERAGNLWLGLRDLYYECGVDMIPTKLVVAESEDEAILKLFKDGFFDYKKSRGIYEGCHLSLRLPRYEEDISIEEDLEKLCNIYYHGFGVRLSYKKLVRYGYEIKKVSEIKVLT